jgi:hypothetical protein
MFHWQHVGQLRLAFAATLLATAVAPALADTSTAPAPLTGKGVISISRTNAGIEFQRDGKPYYIKGVGGQTNLALAAECGANSTRTWGENDAVRILNQAQSLGMTATIGVWLDHSAAWYANDGNKAKMRQNVASLVAKVKDHPAMLIYALGNETNSGADTPEAWAFINELAQIVHKGDPNHPTMTVLAGSSTKTINNVAQYAPAIDILGINTYGGIPNAPRDAESSNFHGPYIITEWGPRGHWEVAKTPWGAPLEPTSDDKMKSYRDSYALITAHKNRCLGSYVFLWGQKEERTPTWYGMFLENKPELGFHGEACPTVDVMAQAWSGKRPANLAPAITSLRIDGDTAGKSTTLKAGAKAALSASATDPDNDKVTFLWEVLPEATQLGSGGSGEGRPKSLANAVKTGDKPGIATLEVPPAGTYRLYLYAFDGKGKAATANVPFLVK